MRKNYITTLLVAACPMGLALTAAAQSTTQTQSAPQASDNNYTLSSDALKAPAATVQSGGASPYELSGTRISGASRSTPVILTAPVNASAAAYKTESGIYLYPTAFAGAGYNSNVASASTNALGSSLLLLAPELIAEMKNKGDRYTALVSGRSTRYASSSQDDTTNTEIKFAGDNYFSSRARAGWSIGQVHSSDPRTASLRATVDNFHTTNLNGRVIYGAPEASGRLELDLGHVTKTYENNRATTALLDLSQDAITGRAYYRLGTRTLALAEVRSMRSKYASALAAASSNTEYRYYGGVTWEATAATTGVVKVGHMSKDFNRPGTDGFSGASWEASVRWLPLTYSAVDLQTARSTNDSSGVGNYEVRTSSDIIWNHKWSQSLTSRVAIGTLSTDFAGANRKDTALNYALTVEYAVLRWMKIGIDFAGTDNSSNVAAGDYKRNITMFTLNASL